MSNRCYKVSRFNKRGDVSEYHQLGTAGQGQMSFELAGTQMMYLNMVCPGKRLI